MALVLPRMNDLTALLGETWAQREAVLNGQSAAEGFALDAIQRRLAVRTAERQQRSGVEQNRLGSLHAELHGEPVTKTFAPCWSPSLVESTSCLSLHPCAGG